MLRTGTVSGEIRTGPHRRDVNVSPGGVEVFCTPGVEEIVGRMISGRPNNRAWYGSNTVRFRFMNAHETLRAYRTYSHRYVQFVVVTRQLFLMDASTKGLHVNACVT